MYFEKNVFYFHFLLLFSMEIVFENMKQIKNLIYTHKLTLKVVNILWK